VWVTREVAGEDEAAAVTAAAAATTTTTTTGLSNQVRAAADPRQPGVSLVCECV